MPLATLAVSLIILIISHLFVQSGYFIDFNLLINFIIIESIETAIILKIQITKYNKSIFTIGDIIEKGSFNEHMLIIDLFSIFINISFIVLHYSRKLTYYNSITNIVNLAFPYDMFNIQSGFEMLSDDFFNSGLLLKVLKINNRESDNYIFNDLIHLLLDLLSLLQQSNLPITVHLTQL